MSNSVSIALVGGDGAGKSSIVKQLRASLSKNYSVSQVDKWDVIKHDLHPTYRFMKDDLPLLRRCVSDMQPVTRTFFLFWTLHGTINERIRQNSDILLLDGYWPKHAASEMFYSGCDSLVKESVKTLFKPDLTFLLDVDPDVAYVRRISDTSTPLVPYECNLDPDTTKASFLLHQERTRFVLREWAHQFDWVLVDANREPALVFYDIHSRVTRHLQEAQEQTDGRIAHVNYVGDVA